MVEIVESYDRDRRGKREKTKKEALDITMIGLTRRKKTHSNLPTRKNRQIDKQKKAKKRD